MTKLSESIIELKAELDVFKESRGDSTATKEYGIISDGLETIPNQIESAINQIRVLAQLNKDLKYRYLDSEEIDLLALTKETFEAFREHWNTKDMESRQGDFFNDFLKAKDTLVQAIRKTNTNEWTEGLAILTKKFLVEDYLIDEQFSLDKESIVRAERFKTASNEFKRKGAVIPKSVIEVEDILNLADELALIGGQILSQNLPKAVVRFMKATRTDDGAGLELLTEEVKIYLESKHAAKDFFIYRRKLFT